MRGLLMCGWGSLYGRLLLQEFLIVGIGHDVKNTAHTVVSKPAELRAYNFVTADRVGREMERDFQAGNGVLLKPQLTNEDIVDYVLGVNEQLDLAIDRDSERGNDDVVATRGIVRIETQGISGGGADLLGIEAPEFSIDARIAEVVNELVGGDFDFDRVGLRLGEADGCPGFVAEKS